MTTTSHNDLILSDKPGRHTTITELELVNISTPPTAIIVGSSDKIDTKKPSLLTSTARIVNPDEETPNTNTRSTTRSQSTGAGVEVEVETENGAKEEEMKPLTLTLTTPTCPASATSGSSSTSPGGALTVPKNKRRPGSSSDGGKVMMTGTVFQGSNGGTPVEVEVELSGRELERLTSCRESGSKENNKRPSSCASCGIIRGPHIMILSFLCIPVAFLISLGLSFHNLSITWYNLFIYLSEEKSVVHRLTLCPLLVLSFPITVGVSTLLLSLVAALIQVSWSWNRWLLEIVDGEKGFCGWLCHKLSLPDCSPYQLVILDHENSPPF